MIKITASLSIAGALLAVCLSAAPARAGPSRTWVSGAGTDSGVCARAAPCRTLAFALTQTAGGGEIDVLDPAGYGPMTITKAISIVNDGVGTAGIHSAGSGATGVTINAGASDSVHLRGLTIEGLGTANIGILFHTGGNLAIENCVNRHFNAGIIIPPSTSSSFSVSNTIANNSIDGIIIEPTGAAVVTGVLSKVTANNNFIGIEVGGSTTTPSLNVTVVDSVASNNTGVGINVFGNTAAVMVRNVVASYNNTGLFVPASAILRVAHSVVTGNNTGVSAQAGGKLFSYGDNDIDGNTNNNTGVL